MSTTIVNGIAYTHLNPNAGGGGGGEALEIIGPGFSKDYTITKAIEENEEVVSNALNDLKQNAGKIDSRTVTPDTPTAEIPVLYYSEQELTSEQKTQAKENIGALEVDNLESLDPNSPLSANQGRILNERVNNLEGIGRFLSLWNAETGLAESTPPVLPYSYGNGCYFRIGTLPTSGSILMPNGSQYTGQPSTTAYSGSLTLEVGDLFVYDAGSNTWLVQKNQVGGKVQDVKVNNTSILVNGEAKFTGEQWTATLTDGTTVTKKVILYD